MLARTGFKRTPYARAPRSALAPVTRGVVVMCSDVATPQPKESPVRSEPYRRLVAMLPCAFCGIAELSQAAHPPPTGKGMKEDDRECFPMCCARPGTPGCHYLFDQYKLMPKTKMRAWAAAAAADTRDTIEGNGLWPKRLPLYEQKQAPAHAGNAQSAMNLGSQA